jgi:hypothetical protein
VEYSLTEWGQVFKPNYGGDADRAHDALRFCERRSKVSRAALIDGAIAYVAETTQEAADTFFPGYARAMTDAGKERGWPAMAPALYATWLRDDASQRNAGDRLTSLR